MLPVRYACIVIGLCGIQTLAQTTDTPFVQEARTIAPVNCKVPNAPSCGDDLTLTEATKYYAAKTPSLTLESAVDFNICELASAKGFYYYWAPSDQMQDGQHAVQTIVEHARAGDIFGRGYMIVRTGESTPDEVHFALCSISIVKKVAGPPTGCTTVAIFTPSRIWLRGGSRHQMCAHMGYSRPTGAIDVTYDVITSLHVERFSESILKLLQSDLGLAAEEKIFQRGEYISIKSTSELRLSQVLGGGWREALDFDVFLRKSNKGMLSVYGTAHVAVCRQAVGNLDEYQGLNDAQRAIYTSKLDALLGAALKKPCTKADQRDSKTITCK